MIAAIARYCFRRRRLVLVLWIALLAALSLGQANANFRTEFSIPDSEAKRGFDLLTEGFGAGVGGQEAQIVFRSDATAADPATQAALEKVFAQAAAPQDGVAVISPFSPEGAQQVAAAGPNAGKIGYARVLFPDGASQSDFLKARNRVVPAVEVAEAAVPGLQVELGGEGLAEFKPPKSEVFGLAFAIVILVLAFGSVLAMGLPIGVALFGVISGAGAVAVLSNLIEIPSESGIIGAMIGLGVGIDYALFIVTRYREELHKGRSPEASAVTAFDTAGRAVLFAGITVVISLMGMLIMGLSFVRGMAIGASVTVALTMLASLTLLPALLGFAGHRVEVTKYRGLVAVSLAAVALFFVGLDMMPVVLVLAVLIVIVLAVGRFIPALNRVRPNKPPKPLNETVWYRWSRFVERRPWPILLAGVALLLVLATPVLSLRLGASDTGNFPEDTTTRKAYDLLSDGFGPGSNGPLLVVARVPSGAEATLATMSTAFASDPNVAFASPARPNADGTVAQWFVIPASAPQDEATTKLVERLREETIPRAVGSSGVEAFVTGNSAIGVDFASFLAGRLPLFIAVVLALSFLLLMAVFRSVLVPLKAVFMNLLSIGAAYGVVVMVFQWGWLADIVGIGRPGPIEPWAPMMLFAIVFGLSMDYEVFLLSRMREEFDRTGDNRKAVADGLASTARVITAAAAIMVFVFGAFLLEPSRQIKLFGLGLAMAILLDATVVRMLLVPAAMELLGARNWWMPKWLDRIVPKLNVEGPAHAPDDLSGLDEAVTVGR